MNTNVNNIRILVGYGSCGIAAGAKDVFETLKKSIPAKRKDIVLEITGCNGSCHYEPIVEVFFPDQPKVSYGLVDPKRAKRIVEDHVLNLQPIDEWTFEKGEFAEGTQAFAGPQTKIVLRNCGMIDPENIEEYLARDGYEALKKCLTSLSPDEIVNQIKDSGLRGRGGGGFPTGVKWQLAKASKSDHKYIICNADEGDPGAFMDRSVLESDPHSVLEGMAIAAFAVGADHAYIYARAEYPLAIKRLNIAMAQAKEKGFLGNNIFGTSFNFDIKLKEGAGAFVCGEETALIASINGERGMPTKRPPYPAVKGLFGEPTNINNVETFANVPWIILNGAEKYAAYGTPGSKGTKVFALAGKVKRGGLVEVPMGMSISDIIENIGGGTISGKPVKAVQLGGPSGGCIPKEHLNIPVDYEELKKYGAIMGSGGMVVMDEDDCMVDIARFFLKFTQNESCGKCTFCRIGTKRMLEILERITAGKGTSQDVDLLSELGQAVKDASLCGLGQTAPNPVLSTIRYFRPEYEAHINEAKCPALKCKALITYSIDAEKCTGCMACVKPCPVQAITGEKKQPHSLDTEKCTRCGVCVQVCKFDSIMIN
jgi:NADH-quinone oxidoreductase subunit F